MPTNPNDSLYVGSVVRAAEVNGGTNVAFTSNGGITMANRLLSVFAISAIALGTACSANRPAPATQAVGVEKRQCDGSETTEGEVQLLRSVKVLDFQPIYSHVLTSNNNSEERVNGAKLIIRPPRGVSAEEMTRILQCHSARVLLGQVSPAAVPNDPYWLPDTWVDIEVKPENGNFAVTVSADSVSSNLQVLGRVHSYADEHMLATEPGLP
jgi:hypothetical protein